MFLIRNEHVAPGKLFPADVPPIWEANAATTNMVFKSIMFSCKYKLF